MTCIDIKERYFQLYHLQEIRASVMTGNDITTNTVLETIVHVCMIGSCDVHRELVLINMEMIKRKDVLEYSIPHLSYLASLWSQGTLK